MQLGRMLDKLDTPFHIKFGLHEVFSNMGCSMNFLRAGITTHQGTASEEVVEITALEDF